MTARVPSMVFAVFMLVAIPALAQTPNPIGTFGEWKAYTYDDEGKKVCFMSSKPSKMEASVAKAKRGDVFFFVTHWAGEGTKNVISVSSGYPFKDGEQPKVILDGKTFDLFAQGEMAWASDQSQDDAISEGVRRGSSLVVKGTSKRGTKTTDTYSLKGSGDAWKAITKECEM